MPIRTILALAALACTCGPVACAQPAESTPPAQQVLPIRLSGTPDSSGRLLVAVYATEASWLDTAVVAHYAEPQAVAGGQLVEIPGVPPGRYAVAVVHDADESGDMTTGIFGIPEEAYGFSNGARGRLGPPSFEESAVEWDGVAEVEVEVKKFGG